MNVKSLLLLICSFTLIGFLKSSIAAEEIYATVSDDVEITVNRYSAEGEYLVLWLAPEYGFRGGHLAMAERLAKQGIEVWQSNIVESLFLPEGTASLKQLDGNTVADLMEYVHKTTAKKIVVAGDSYATISALRGAHRWQSRQQTNPYLIGAILFSPYTFAYIPQLGLDPEFMPIVSASNIPIMIYQARNSGAIGQFKTLLENLRRHNSPIYTRFVPNVMSLFYEDPPTQAMLDSAQPIPDNIRQMISVLASHKVPTTAVPLKSTEAADSGIDIYLKAFRGQKTPPVIQLQDINGRKIVKRDYTGKVTLVNFWASWCPPCIEEIPSFNRLKKIMEDQPFELISINFAEDRKTISDFMQTVAVEFPVLLDPTGEISKRWNVVSYPSTFIIDTDGSIKYGVNAAIGWDSPEVVRKLQILLDPVK